MTLNDEKLQNKPPNRALVARKRSRRLELMVAGVALLIIIVLALARRDPAEGAPTGGQQQPASAAVNH